MVGGSTTPALVDVKGTALALSVDEEDNDVALDADVAIAAVVGTEALVLGTDDDDVALAADVVIAAAVLDVAVVIADVVVAGGRGQLGCPRFEQTTLLWHSFGA